jgi:prepilin-type N-terminal cleavage/methylation domain-containing protein
MTGRRLRGECGFTLTELVITIVIMAVIILPLGNFVIEYFINTGTTVARLSESHDEQLAASYFAQDVANVGTRDSNLNMQQSVWTGSFPSGHCGASVAAGDQVLLLEWDDRWWNNSVTPAREEHRIDAVAYVRATASGETQLRRIYCKGNSQVSDNVVVHNLDPGVTPLVTCSTTCTAAAVPASISLQVRIAEPSSDGQPLTVTLNGERRQT